MCRGAAIAIGCLLFVVGCSAGGTSPDIPATKRSFSDTDAYAFGYVTAENNPSAMDDGRCDAVFSRLRANAGASADQEGDFLLGCMDGGMGREPMYQNEVDGLRLALQQN